MNAWDLFLLDILVAVGLLFVLTILAVPPYLWSVYRMRKEQGHGSETR